MLMSFNSGNALLFPAQVWTKFGVSDSFNTAKLYTPENPINYLLKIYI